MLCCNLLYDIFFYIIKYKYVVFYVFIDIGVGVFLICFVEDSSYILCFGYCF